MGDFDQSARTALLHQIAEALDVPVSTFTSSAQQGADSTSVEAELVHLAGRLAERDDRLRLVAIARAFVARVQQRG